MDNYKLYDSNNHILLNKSIKSFQLFDSWIYYVSSKENSLYRISIDGQVQEKLYDVKNKLNLLSFYVDNSGIYCFVGSCHSEKCIYKFDFNMKLLSTYEIDEVPIEQESIVAVNGKVFFVTRSIRNDGWVKGFKLNSLYCVDNEGEFILIEDNITTLYPRVFNGYIFYTKKRSEKTSSLYKLNVENEVSNNKALYICHVNEEWFNVSSVGFVLHPFYHSAYSIHNGFIYYSDADKKSYLSKVEINGNGEEVLSNETHVKSIKIIGDWIYYRGYNGEYITMSDGIWQFNKYNNEYGKDVSCRIRTDGSKKEYIADYFRNRNCVNVVSDIKFLINNDYKYEVSNIDDESNLIGCYLTTACIEYKGLSDDCKELNYIKKFQGFLYEKIYAI